MRDVWENICCFNFIGHCQQQSQYGINANINSISSVETTKLPISSDLHVSCGNSASCCYYELES